MDQSRRPMILVADDSRVAAEMTRRWLRQAGAEVVVVTDGLEARVAGFNDPFDCAILDQVMPGMVGAEVLQIWRDSGLTFPIIMISAVQDERTRKQALELGANAYLYKPVEREDLIAVVNDLLVDSELALDS